MLPTRVHERYLLLPASRGPGCRAGASAALVLRGAVSVLFHKPLLGLRSERAGSSWRSSTSPRPSWFSCAGQRRSPRLHLDQDAAGAARQQCRHDPQQVSANPLSSPLMLDQPECQPPKPDACNGGARFRPPAGLNGSHRVLRNPSGALRSGRHRPDVVAAHGRCGIRLRIPGVHTRPGSPPLPLVFALSSVALLAGVLLRLALLVLTLLLLVLLACVFRCLVDAPHLTAILVGGVVERAVTTKPQVDRPRPSGKSRDGARVSRAKSVVQARSAKR